MRTSVTVEMPFSGPEVFAECREVASSAAPQAMRLVGKIIVRLVLVVDLRLGR
jgi:hypothetical protein